MKQIPSAEFAIALFLLAAFAATAFLAHKYNLLLNKVVFILRQIGSDYNTPIILADCSVRDFLEVDRWVMGRRQEMSEKRRRADAPMSCLFFLTS